MKVHELIGALKGMPPEHEVHFWLNGTRREIEDVVDVGDCVDLYEADSDSDTPKYLRIDLLEPISGDAMMEPDDAMKELRDYLLNEFDNHGIQAVLTLVDEPQTQASGWRKRQIANGGAA